MVTECFKIAVNDSDAKESGRCKRVLVITELVVSWTQCIRNRLKKTKKPSGRAKYTNVKNQGKEET